jgi:hypothetical protein
MSKLEDLQPGLRPGDHGDPVLMTDEQEPFLTLEEACRAAYYFVLQYYGRERITPFMLMLTSMKLEGKQETNDPAHWHDWLASVEKALADPDLPDPDAPLDNR